MVNVSQKVSPNLTFSWEDLLTLLRDELQEYGGLIGLLSAQQQSILNRRPDSLMELNQSVQTQMEASQILHKRRQGFVSSLAQGFGESENSSLSEIVDHFPDVTQPMFHSIIEEINSLISQVRKKIEQNQRLLMRLSEVTDQILSVTDPSSQTKTYTRDGNLKRLSSGRSNLSESA
ncbi:flagellar protein FlgN [Opitutales bacterium]|jgi:flagellar biosynthesis/type III secretory pathway chaperone|nr:flagellar protein FlgN [Opitutales bacterium]